MTKPSLPKEIQIGPHRYSVTNDEKEHAKECRKTNGGTDADGISNHRTCRITISPKQHFTQQQDTMLHEVVHSVWRNGGWDTKIPKQQVDAEEYIVQRITATLLDVIQRNPKLVEFLTYTGPLEVVESRSDDGNTEGITQCHSSTISQTV